MERIKSTYFISNTENVKLYIKAKNQELPIREINLFEDIILFYKGLLCCLSRQISHDFCCMLYEEVHVLFHCRVHLNIPDIIS